MKKEENQKKNTALKNECDFRLRSHSPKAYLGCDTCRFKNFKLNCKLTDFSTAQDKSKLKKSTLEKDERGFKNPKIKLTDLCDEDKKRIVELIEELSKLADKNQQLAEQLEKTQKEKQEQQEYVMKQAKTFLEEKNFYLNEINECKTKMEAYESEIRNKTFQWENHGRFKDSEIMFLAKALQKSLKEKKELNEQMNHLKVCLKHSLESFQKLRAEVSTIQSQEQPLEKYKSTTCQTESKTNLLKGKTRVSDEGSDEEDFWSTCNQDSVKARSSLNIFNDKLEYVYQLLRKKGELLPNSPPQKYDIDLSILLKNEKSADEKEGNDTSPKNEDEPLKIENEESEDKFLKPFEQCSKTLVQAERILKKIGKPLNLTGSDCPQTQDMNNLSNFILREPSSNILKNSNFLQNNIVQKNNLFKTSEDHQYDEDRLLEELFYSDQILDLGLESILKSDSKEKNLHFTDRPW